tara:strand:+ start:131348 stop:131677 length:330 start_codon:yes stop_codon:yes gene_type:complete
MNNKFVDYIAKMVTEDPDLLNEKQKRPKIKSVADEMDDPEFDVDDALEDKDGPADPSKKRKKRSSLDDNEGAKQTGKAEVKPKTVTPKVFKNSKEKLIQTISESIIDGF